MLRLCLFFSTFNTLWNIYLFVEFNFIWILLPLPDFVFCGPCDLWISFDDGLSLLSNIKEKHFEQSISPSCTYCTSANKLPRLHVNLQCSFWLLWLFISHFSNLANAVSFFISAMFANKCNFSCFCSTWSKKYSDLVKFFYNPWITLTSNC